MSSAVLVAALGVIVAGSSLWGWGCLVRLAARGPELSAPLTASLGLGAILFLGGVFNALGLAYAPALDALVLIGLVAAGLILAARGAFRRRPRARWTDALALFPLILAGAWAAAHLLPQQSFNVFDDFEKYFAYPVRMLATGSLGGNRLSALGGETLGGQAWLQGFVLAHFPVNYLGAADTFLGLLLCGALAGFARRPAPWALGALAAECAVVLINPQIINISTVFIGAALVMAAVFIGGASDQAGRPAPSAWIGLLYAGMIALKTTFLLFVVMQTLTFAVAQLWLEGFRGPWLRRAAAATGWTGLFLAPWLAVYASYYLAALHVPALTAPVLVPEPFGLFSTAPELYGGTQLHYTALAFAALVAAGWTGLAVRRDWLRLSPALTVGVVGLATAALAYFVLILWLTPAFGREGATRYAAPIFIGVVPAAIRLLWDRNERPGARWPWLLPLALLGPALAAFLPSTGARIRQVSAYGSPLAFTPSAITGPYIDYNRSVLSGSVRSRLASLQQRVPPHAAIVVWVSTPFWLDYKRNEVIQTSLAGLGTRWAWPPPARYYLWEYRGYAVRYPGFVHWVPADYTKIFLGECLMDRINSIRALAFAQYLENRAKNSDVLYNDGSLALFRTR